MRSLYWHWHITVTKCHSDSIGIWDLYQSHSKLEKKKKKPTEIFMRNMNESREVSYHITQTVDEKHWDLCDEKWMTALWFYIIQIRHTDPWTNDSNPQHSPKKQTNKQKSGANCEPLDPVHQTRHYSDIRCSYRSQRFLSLVLSACSFSFGPVAGGCVCESVCWMIVFNVSGLMYWSLMYNIISCQCVLNCRV